MKKIVNTIREIIDELRKDLDVYISIQRYVRASRKNKS